MYVLCTVTLCKNLIGILYHTQLLMYNLSVKYNVSGCTTNSKHRKDAECNNRITLCVQKGRKRIQQYVLTNYMVGYHRRTTCIVSGTLT